MVLHLTYPPAKTIFPQYLARYLSTTPFPICFLNYLMAFNGGCNFLCDFAC